MSDYSLLEVSATYSPNEDLSRPRSQLYLSKEYSTVTTKLDTTVSASTSGTTVDLGTFTTLTELIVYNQDTTNYILAKARCEKASKTFEADKLGFVNSNPDTITDDDSTFVSSLYFEAGDIATVSSATESGNNGSFLVQAVAAGTLTLASAESLTADADDAGTPTIKSRRDCIQKIGPGQMVVFTNVVPGSDLTLTANTAACLADVFGWGS